MTKNNDGNSGRKFGKLKNIANIGDIVSVVGYELGVFQVESWTHEVDYQPDYTAENILYDVTDLKTHQFLLAFQEDVSVVCRADKADEYLNNLGIRKDFKASDLTVDVTLDIDPVWQHVENMLFMRKEAEYMAEKPKQIPEQERINRFLDEINDYEDLIRNFGDENGEYQAKIDSAKRKLANIVEGGR